MDFKLFYLVINFTGLREFLKRNYNTYSILNYKFKHMKTFKNIFLILAVCSITLFACKKHCKDDDNCMKTKNGIHLTGAQEN